MPKAIPVHSGMAFVFLLKTNESIDLDWIRSLINLKCQGLKIRFQLQEAGFDFEYRSFLLKISFDGFTFAGPALKKPFNFHSHAQLTANESFSPRCPAWPGSY